MGPSGDAGAGGAERRRGLKSATLLLSLLVAACGTQPASPPVPPSTVRPATASPRFLSQSPSPSLNNRPRSHRALSAVQRPRLAVPWSPLPCLMRPTARIPRRGRRESPLLHSGASRPPPTASCWQWPVPRTAAAQPKLLAADGAKLATLADGGAAVTCLAWSPNGSLLAGASRAGDVGLWDRHGQLVRILHGTDPVFSLAWSPDGDVLATGAIHFPAPTTTGAAALPGVVRLWSRDGSFNRTLGTQFTGGKFLNIRRSPDG